MVQQRKIGTGISTQAPQPSSVFLGPRSLGREEPQTSISFSEIRYLDWAEGEGRTVFVGILKDFGISVKTLSHYS